LNEQWLFVQHGCQTACTSGLTTGLYRVSGVLLTGNSRQTQIEKRCVV